MTGGTGCGWSAATNTPKAMCTIAGDAGKVNARALADRRACRATRLVLPEHKQHRAGLFCPMLLKAYQLQHPHLGANDIFFGQDRKVSVETAPRRPMRSKSYQQVKLSTAALKTGNYWPRSKLSIAWGPARRRY